MTGRPKVPLVLRHPNSRRSIVGSGAHAPGRSSSSIVLACATWSGQPNRGQEGVSLRCRWRARFVTRRVDGLLDEPRPGAPRTITDDTARP